MSETIINGIDVSECKYYDDGTCCNEDVLALSCDKTDCIYKQLKRLQQENEELKDKNKSIAKDYVGVFGDYQKYKQALEEIREKCLKMCNICDNINGETYLDDCNSICEYCKIIDLINEILNV